MSKMEYKYFLLRKCWLARLEKDKYNLEPKEFLKDDVWQYDDQLNLELNDSIMDYGDSSVFDYDELSEEDALKLITSWDRYLSEQQILSAKECYLFGDDVLYIAVDENSDLFVCHLKNKSWSKRSSNSFWDSWDSAPYLFLPVSNEEAVKKIYSDDETLESIKDIKDKGKVDAKPTSENIIVQMVDGIVGKESENPSEREKEIRNRLSGRAWEYLMFMDEGDE